MAPWQTIPKHDLEMMKIEADLIAAHTVSTHFAFRSIPVAYEDRLLPNLELQEEVDQHWAKVVDLSKEKEQLETTESVSVGTGDFVVSSAWQSQGPRERNHGLVALIAKGNLEKIRPGCTAVVEHGCSTKEKKGC